MVGQDYAKKVQSVAVYNHYKRLNNNLPDQTKTNHNIPQVIRSSGPITDNARVLQQATFSNMGEYTWSNTMECTVSTSDYG